MQEGPFGGHQDQYGRTWVQRAADCGYGGGYGGYGGYNNGYAQGGARVLGVTSVERRSNNGLRVRGVATANAYATAYGNPYGGGYGGL